MFYVRVQKMSFSLGNRVDIDALKWKKKPEEEQIGEKKICLILSLRCLFVCLFIYFNWGTVSSSRTHQLQVE